MDINFLFDPNEKPLDRIITDGGYCAILRTVACIGDSLSSGEFESRDENGRAGYHDYYEYSWGQYLARMAGLKAYNFSEGGMTAEKYVNKFADEKGFWDKSLAAQAYVIALGANDLINGSIDDVCVEDYTKNAPTYAGYYAQIIQRYKEIQPDAKFFLVTFPKCNGDSRDILQRSILCDIAAKLDNCYVIDLQEYSTEFNDDFRKKFFIGGHMTAAGYLYMAQLIGSYIDYIIRHNMEDFSQIGFVGTPYKYIK